jgi:hypothetical protein
MNIEEVKKAKIIGNKPTVTDWHRWMNERELNFYMGKDEIIIARYFYDCDECSFRSLYDHKFEIPYESSKPLLSQSEETKQAIIDLITSYS